MPQIEIIHSAGKRFTAKRAERAEKKNLQTRPHENRILWPYLVHVKEFLKPVCGFSHVGRASKSQLIFVGYRQTSLDFSEIFAISAVNISSS